MIDYTEALDLVLTQDFDWGTESVALTESTGRILREPVVTDRDQPPFDRVTMDGIALNFATYASGRRVFQVQHLAPAGAPTRPLDNPEACIEVMTGTVLPPGTTTVVRYEDLEREGDAFRVTVVLQDGKNIHRKGSDARKEERLAEPGAKIGPAMVALLATCGYEKVRVARWPRVAIVGTGDEIVPVGATPLPYQIRASNAHQLASLWRLMGIQPVLDHLPDDPNRGPERLRKLVQEYDILLLTGGVSKGKRDFVPGWLAELGVQQLFHRVAQRPGKPLWVGRNDSTMIFALPGNPVSCLVSTLIYVGPFLRRSVSATHWIEQHLALAEDISFQPDLTLFRAVHLLREVDDAQLLALPVRHGGSGDATSLLRTDGFVVLPRGRDNFRAGEVFPYVSIGHLI